MSQLKLNINIEHRTFRDTGITLYDISYVGVQIGNFYYVRVQRLRKSTGFKSLMTSFTTLLLKVRSSDSELFRKSSLAIQYSALTGISRTFQTMCFNICEIVIYF